MTLTELDKAIIYSIYRKGNRSKKAHFPVEAICRWFKKHLRGDVKRRVEKLVSKGYLYSKPHPSGHSYGLTDLGWKTAMELEQELLKREKGEKG